MSLFIPDDNRQLHHIDVAHSIGVRRPREIADLADVGGENSESQLQVKNEYKPKT
jgi:hypothetical protein